MAIAYQDTSESRMGVKVEAKHRRSSLFTNEEDRRLPLLTKIAQLQDGDEDGFVRQFDSIQQYPESKRLLSDGEIEELRDIRNLARSIMEQIADENRVYFPEVNLLSDKLRQWEPRYSIISNLFSDNECQFVTVGNAKRVPEGYSGLKAICYSVLKGLDGLLDTPGRIRRCDECHNPYLIQRETGDNRYCSNRCSNRVRVRRSKQKESEKTDKVMA